MSKKEKNIINNRSEIVYLYETNNNNPNGDPLYENRPRMDETTQRCLVSDVRLKRNVRDYLLSKGETILISEWENDDGTIKMAKDRALALKSGLKANQYDKVKDEILKQCIDARLFGCAIPLGTGNRSIQLTGPVQFLYGMSEFPVQIDEIQGTAAFAGKKGDKQRSFRNEFIIPFALIKFYGVINEQLAEEVSLTEEDVEKLENSIWEGTLNLQSRSKVGHKPRLYFRIIYKPNKQQIGLIHHKVKTLFDTNKDGTELRSIDEITIDLSDLKVTLEKHKDNIEKIIFRESLDLRYNGYDSFEDFLTKLGLPR